MRVKIAALVLALGIGVLTSGMPQQVRAGAGEGNAEIAVDRTARGPFSLVDHAGQRVTDADFRDRFLLVFFGYTFCPDVCPTDLQTIGSALNALGDAGKRVQPIFITLDPERDTAEVLARYVRHFHPRFLGLTGTSDEIALAAQTFGVIHVKVAKQDGRYSLDHTAFTYLLGPDARFRAAFAHGIEPGRLAAGISKHLKGAGR